MLQYHDKTFKGEKLLLTDEQRCFLEVESTPDEDAVETAEMIKRIYNIT